MTDQTREALRAPQLSWKGPDEDGDYLVSLTGVRASLTAHGQTREQALAHLGEAIHLALCQSCKPAEGTPTPQADFDIWAVVQVSREGAILGVRGLHLDPENAEMDKSEADREFQKDILEQGWPLWEVRQVAHRRHPDAREEER